MGHEVQKRMVRTEKKAKKMNEGKEGDGSK
jgi:hypothetical protein